MQSSPWLQQKLKNRRHQYLLTDSTSLRLTSRRKRVSTVVTSCKLLRELVHTCKSVSVHRLVPQCSLELTKIYSMSWSSSHDHRCDTSPQSSRTLRRRYPRKRIRHARVHRSWRSRQHLHSSLRNSPTESAPPSSLRGHKLTLRLSMGNMTACSAIPRDESDEQPVRILRSEEGGTTYLPWLPQPC